MQEIWRPIPGYEGLYEISNYGHVNTLRENPGRIRGGLSHGYRVIFLSVNGERRSIYPHRLVAELFIGPPPPGCEVNHIDGNKDNNCVDNLEWVTHRDNILHARKLGLIKRQVRGERCGSSKLTEDQVRFIRANARHYTQRELASRFGVSQPAIGAILAWRTWTHVE